MPVEKVRCACGCYVGKFGLNRHKMTKKHLKLMDVMRPMTLSEVMEKMSDLEEKIDDISSGEYLFECNRLKSIYDRLKRDEQREITNNMDLSSILMMLFG